MSFKLKAPYPVDWTSVYRLGEDGGEGINGVTTQSGNVVLNKNLCDPAQVANTLSHEMVHVDQMKRGELAYDDKYIYWKGKKYLRSSLEEGNKKLPWEAEAYKKEKPIT